MRLGCARLFTPASNEPAGHAALVVALRAAVCRLRAEILLPAGLALVLGLVTLGRKSWWLDEAFNVHLAAANDWPHYLARTGYYEASQALYLVPFKVWRAFTPETEWFTRFPSVVYAAAAAGLVGMLGTRMFGPCIGVLCGVFLATNASLVAWSQQARTYSLAVLAVVLVTFLFVTAARSRRRRPWLVYGAASAVGIYAHFFLAFVLTSHAVLVGRMAQAKRRGFTVAAALIAVAAVPATPYVFLNGPARTSWIPPASPEGLRTAVLEVVGYNRLLLLAAGLGAAVLLVGRDAVARWNGWLLIGWAVSPFACAIVLSSVKPLLLGRYLIVTTPALAILAAVGVAWLRPRWLAAGATAAILAVCGVELARWYERPAIQDWRAAAGYVAGRERGGATVVLVRPHLYLYPYMLYAPLPAACRYAEQETHPRCNFRVTGSDVVVVAPEADPNWHQLMGSGAYALRDTHSFEGLRVFDLRRRGAR